MINELSCIIFFLLKKKDEQHIVYFLNFLKKQGQALGQTF